MSQSGLAILTVRKEGGEVLKSLPLEGEISVGRADACSIRLEDRAISRQHAVFKQVGESVQVEKKSEFAPLTVNGIECTRAVLKEGDIVHLGPYSIVISSPQPVPAPALVASPPPADTAQSPSPAAEFPPLNLSDSPTPEMPNLDQSPDAMGNENGLGNMGTEEAAGVEFNISQENSESPDAGLALQPPQEVVEEFEAVDEDEKTKITPSAKLTVKLMFPQGSANVTEYEITQDEVSIGRGKDCDIVLNDKKSSRKNSIIRRAGIHFSIKDLGSSNGTLVNGVKVEEHQLSGDDLIKIGSVEFQFRVLSADYVKNENQFLSLPAEVEEPDFASNQPEALPPVPSDPALPADLNPNESNPAAPIPGGIPGPELGNIPGITGISGSSGGKKTLLERFRALPKRTQLIAVVAILMFLYWVMEDEEVAPIPKKKTVAEKKAPAAKKGPGTFESLTPEQQQFVESQHALAFDHYKNKDYDKALYEITKIFTLVSDYKDAREIERYAKEGKRKLDAIEEERKKKEEEAKLKAKVEMMVGEARELMRKKQYDQARELFSQILSLDPDNIEVANWRKEIEAYEEKVKMEEQQRQVQLEINKHAWEIFSEAVSFKKVGKYHSAISTFQKSLDVGASDPKLAPSAKKMMAQCRAAIKGARDPLLAEAKQLEANGEFSKAFALYKKATLVDPPHPEGYAGMDRVRNVLHERAKAIYTEAVLAESYSDFAAAKKLFQECLNVSPPDDIYHERAQRRISHYFRKDEGPPQ